MDVQADLSLRQAAMLAVPLTVLSFRYTLSGIHDKLTGYVSLSSIDREKGAILMLFSRVTYQRTRINW